MKLFVSADSLHLSNVLDDADLINKKMEEDRFEILQRELNLLSVVDKALISLMLEGLSMKEIAEVIGITESNVKTKIHRIKMQLKNKLKQKEYVSK